MFTFGPAYRQHEQHRQLCRAAEVEFDDDQKLSSSERERFELVAQALVARLPKALNLGAQCPPPWLAQLVPVPPSLCDECVSR